MRILEGFPLVPDRRLLQLVAYIKISSSRIKTKELLMTRGAAMIFLISLYPIDHES